jgi:hypothetical protein
MAPAAAIARAASSLQAAGHLVKSLIGLKVTAEVQAKIVELQTAIFDAQGDALAAQAEQFTLTQRVRDLEAEVADAKAWEAEKQRYQLQEFPTGALAYVLKPETANGEPPHRICPNCYQEGHKSILQTTAKHSGGEMVDCLRCKSRLVLSDFVSGPIDYGDRYVV